MHTITRRFEFDAGHRVYLHESKCSHLHGHRYKVDVEVTSNVLDNIGRIIDFSVVKDICGKWIDENLDHGLILFESDGLLSLLRDYPIMPLQTLVKQKIYVMNSNPTAENIANHLYHLFNRLLEPTGVKVVSITLFETPNCKAVYKE